MTAHTMESTVAALIAPGKGILAADESLPTISGAILFDETMRQKTGGAPWQLSFSFGRALQDMAMKTWHGVAANAVTAQAALHHRARCNGLAVLGKYSKKDESPDPVPPTVK